MPYAKNSELPASIREALPAAAQSTFRSILNNALKQYGADKDGEEKSFATAWAGLKNAGWSKKDGKWVHTKKAELPFMRLVKQEVPQRYTLGIVYEPNVYDAHDDWATAEDIEHTCWTFMRKLQGQTDVTKFSADLLAAVIKTLSEETTVRLDVTDLWDEVTKVAGTVRDMHDEHDDDYGEVVENYIAAVDFTIDEELVRKGTWLLGVIWDESYFHKIQNGERTGYSMGGRARRLLDESIEEMSGDA